MFFNTLVYLSLKLIVALFVLNIYIYIFRKIVDFIDKRKNDKGDSEKNV